MSPELESLLKAQKELFPTATALYVSDLLGGSIEFSPGVTAHGTPIDIHLHMGLARSPERAYVARCWLGENNVAIGSGYTAMEACQCLIDNANYQELFVP